MKWKFDIAQSEKYWHSFRSVQRSPLKLSENFKTRFLVVVLVYVKPNVTCNVSKWIKNLKSGWFFFSDIFDHFQTKQFERWRHGWGTIKSYDTESRSLFSFILSKLLRMLSLHTGEILFSFRSDCRKNISAFKLLWLYLWHRLQVEFLPHLYLSFPSHMLTKTVERKI